MTSGAGATQGAKCHPTDGHAAWPPALSPTQAASAKRASRPKGGRMAGPQWEWCGGTGPRAPLAAETAPAIGSAQLRVSAPAQRGATERGSPGAAAGAALRPRRPIAIPLCISHRPKCAGRRAGPPLGAMRRSGSRRPARRRPAGAWTGAPPPHSPSPSPAVHHVPERAYGLTSLGSAGTRHRVPQCMLRVHVTAAARVQQLRLSQQSWAGGRTMAAL